MNLPPPAGPAADPWRGILFKIGSTTGFAALGALVKQLSLHYPLGEIAFCRCFFMLLPVLAFAARQGDIRRLLSTSRLLAHARRAVAGALGLLMGFATLRLLPFADATALSYSAPLFLTALAIPLLGERVGPYRLSAVIAGFIGVLLIIQPHAAHASQTPHAVIGIVTGVMAGLCVAFAQLALRALRAEPAVTTVFYFSLFMSVLTLLSAPFGWHWPSSASDAALLFLTGIIGGLAQLSVTQSYRFADASVLAPYDYLQLIWAVILGYLLFGETPLPIVLLGAFIVAAAGIFIALRERALQRRGQPVEPHSAPPSM